MLIDDLINYDVSFNYIMNVYETFEFFNRESGLRYHNFTDFSSCICDCSYQIRMDLIYNFNLFEMSHRYLLSL